MTAPALERVLSASIPLQAGLARLADEVRVVQRLPRTASPADGVSAMFEAELRLGIEAADPARAYEAAIALWRRSGDPRRCYSSISRALAQAAAACTAGECTVAVANRMCATALEVLHRLRADARPATRDTSRRVVLAVPPGEGHVLALLALGHLLEEAGWTADVVGELPAAELARTARGAVAVVLSVHASGADLDGLVHAVRHVEPDALVVVGGPAATGVHADLVTSDPALLLRALQARRCPLSERERDVLRCIADGLTNAEAAAVLGVAPATLKTHLDRIFDKTGASGRAGAVATGLRRGWIV